MKGRNFTNTTGYRYGFNGKEKDDEVKGEGDSYDFGARIYDSRLARWLAMDPLYPKYPSHSSYSFALNTPVQAIDPKGEDIFYVTQSTNSKGDVEIKQQNFTNIINTLASTEKGKALLEHYINNPKEHLYIDIGVITNKEAETSLDATYTFSKGQLSMATDSKSGQFENNYPSETPELSGFNGVVVDQKADKSSFITLAEESFSVKDPNFYSIYSGPKLGAKVLGHAIGAHSDEIGHNSWGQETYSGEKNVGTGPAKVLNTQLNHLLIENKKTPYQLAPVKGQQGVFKITTIPESGSKGTPGPVEAPTKKE